MRHPFAVVTVETAPLRKVSAQEGISSGIDFCQPLPWASALVPSPRAMPLLSTVPTLQHVVIWWLRASTLVTGRSIYVRRWSPLTDATFLGPHVGANASSQEHEVSVQASKRTYRRTAIQTEPVKARRIRNDESGIQASLAKPSSLSHQSRHTHTPPVIMRRRVIAETRPGPSLSRAAVIWPSAREMDVFTTMALSGVAQEKR